MPNVCLYFQVHQPYRLRDLRITDIGNQTELFDEQKNGEIFRKVAHKCYLPANALMLELLEKHPEFRISYSLSGVFLDQCEEYGEDVLDSFRALAATGKVEFLAETYYHSLSYLKSISEFCTQITKHVNKIEELFGIRPTVFRNTELIYCNDLSHIARFMGFKGILAEGADFVLRGRTPNDPYKPPKFDIPKEKQSIIRKLRPHSKASKGISILLKNYQLSDDVAFRFSQQSWQGFPLYSETFTKWIRECGGHTVNLFMDYETFGEHQWEDTGIFEFLRQLPEAWNEHDIKCLTPSQTIDAWKYDSDTFNAHTCISWADTERDLSAWQGNHIQDSALHAIYELEDAVKNTKNEELIEMWRRLQTSDHFYYMCTKFWNDGDVHKYFSPYDSPYEAYRRFSHALHDLQHRITTCHPEESPAGRGRHEG